MNDSGSAFLTQEGSAATSRPGQPGPVRAQDDLLLPTIRLDPASLSPEQRFDAFCDAAGGSYDLSFTDRDARRRGVTAAAWRLSELLLIDATSAGLLFTRRRNRFYSTGDGLVRLLIHKTDGTRLAMGDEIRRLDSGAIHLVDVEREQTVISEPSGSYTVLFLPHAAVGYDPARHPACLRIDLRSGKGVILDATLRSLRGMLDEVRASEAPALAAAISGLVRSCLTGQADEAGAGSATRRNRVAAMRAFLETRLGEPELGLPALAAAFGASRATIYRDFEPHGGVDRYISQRRLERAYIDLLHRRPSTGAVTEAAHGWGFSSASYFCRRFREEFGCPPSDMVGAAAPEARIEAEGGIAGSLLRELLGPRRQPVRA